VRACSYWWNADEEEWCDLTDAACECGGRRQDCSLSDKSIAAALREEEKATLAEAARRARRARKQQEAS